MIDFGFGISDLELEHRRKLRAPSFRTPHSAIRNGLTLVELLVVIIILTTLVGGVIPVLSPNNDERKIRAAGRGLQGYISLVQAKAARKGRPHGIAFIESSLGSGVALEVFGLEVPPPFAGFSTQSRVRVEQAVDVVNNPGGDDITYGPRTPQNPQGNRQTQFSPKYFGFPLYRLRFELAAVVPTPPATYVADQLPPRMFSVGDVIDVDGNQFLIVDDERQFIEGSANGVTGYLDPEKNPDLVFTDSLICVWINFSGQVIPQGLKRYAIQRQPANSADAPYQLPAGIVIDMQASITEGNESLGRFPVGGSLYSDRTAIPASEATSDSIGIMFSPTGAVDSVFFNGVELENISRIVLLLGRIENAGIVPTMTPLPWVFDNVNDKDEREEKQEQVNWLNPDSRLLSIVPSNGRVVVSEPAFVDVRLLSNASDAEEQIEAAHGFAHEMTTVGGN